MSFLNAEDIGAYLQLECPKHRFPDTLCELLHVRTEGNPLFVVDLVRYLRERGVITETEGVWTCPDRCPTSRPICLSRFAA